MNIRAQLMAMADTEVLSLIDPRKLKEVQAEDPHPLFKAFCIGQEGEARPSLVGIGGVIARWYRAAVQALCDKLRIGTKVFHLHSGTNAHAGRTVIGEVVGKAVQEIRGVLSSIAVTHILPEYRDLPLDVASIEADVLVPEGVWDFDVQSPDVLDVTGIALGNSAVNRPAFAGATLLASLQAFAETHDRQKGGEIMTAAEIKKLIREAGLQPSDVFTTRELTADPTIEEEMAEKSPTNAEFARMRRELADTERKLQTAEDRSTKAEKDLSEARANLTVKERAVLKVTSKDLAEAAIAERKLGEAEAKFVRKRLNRFDPKSEESLKTDLNTFLDGQITEFNETLELAGVKGGGNGKPGIGADDQGTGLKDEDYVNPEKNPLIPR